MGIFYFDESIHERAGFILGGFVYGEDDPSHRIADAIAECGLNPEIDEFKSSFRMSDHPEQIELRKALRSILHMQYQIGIVVAPSSDRDSFGKEALIGLAKIIKANGLSSTDVSAYFDQGIFNNVVEAETFAVQLSLVPNCKLFFEQDSRFVRGIQLADLVAHTCSTMLLDTLGLVTKQVKAGPSSGYDPDLELNLGFELWARIRYQFFNGGLPKIIESNDDMIVDVASYGLHISDAVPKKLHEATLSRFGRCYWGCIH